jgi:hypothetical protein
MKKCKKRKERAGLDDDKQTNQKKKKLFTAWARASLPLSILHSCAGPARWFYSTFLNGKVMCNRWPHRGIPPHYFSLLFCPCMLVFVGVFLCHILSHDLGCPNHSPPLLPDLLPIIETCMSLAYKSAQAARRPQFWLWEVLSPKP